MGRMLLVALSAVGLLGAAGLSLASPEQRAALLGWLAPCEELPPLPQLTAVMHGKVTLDGHTVPCGMVKVFDDAGRQFHAPIHQGKFFLPGAPAGKVRLAVDAPPIFPTGDGTPIPSCFPDRYRSHTTSGLGGVLSEGPQDVTLELESQGSPR